MSKTQTKEDKKRLVFYTPKKHKSALISQRGNVDWQLMRVFNYEICNPGSEVAKHPGGGTPYDGLYGEAPPERGTYFRVQVYEE